MRFLDKAMKAIFRVAALISCVGLCAPSFGEPLPQQSMTITYYRPPKAMVKILGSHWYIFLDGKIEGDTAEKVEAFLKNNNVPPWSFVILNSPGGSLFGGMELGRIFRKYQLNTDVGVQSGRKNEKYEYTSGECYSSCTYAYLGGNFRFLKKGSHYGVHRFYASNPAYNSMDVAQITSAQIVSYLREMEVDPEFFNLSTKAGADGIFEPPRPLLEKLSIVNNGWGTTTWSVESKKGVVYLKGERNTQYGINKFMLVCVPKAGLFLHMIFDPQGRQDEVLKMPAHSLVLDMQDEPIAPMSTEIVNGWFNADYRLTEDQLRRIAEAKTVGVILRWSYEGPVFLGFNAMPFGDGADKLPGVANSCGR